MAQTIKKIKSEILEDIIFSPGAILGGQLGAELNNKIWDVTDEDSSHVTFATESLSGLRVEIKYTRIDTGKLFIDVSAAASADTDVALSVVISVKNKNYATDDFNGRIPGDCLKAKYELKAADSSARLTLYNDCDARLIEKADHIELISRKDTAALQAGQTVSMKILLAEDHLLPREQLEALIDIDAHDTECIFTGIDRHESECIFSDIDRHEPECIFSDIDRHESECIFSNIDRHEPECIFSNIDRHESECVNRF